MVLYAQGADFLEVLVHVDAQRLRVLDPTLASTPSAPISRPYARCAGGADAGPAGQGTPGERFRCLVAPRSTVVRPSPVHTGTSADLGATLGRLLERMVLARAEPPSAAPMS